MKALAELSAAEATSIRGMVFDLDDTVLDHGALTEAAYSSLFRLKELGLKRIACTGRPAGWAEIIMRQWPLDAAIAENGAIAFVRNDKAMIFAHYLQGEAEDRETQQKTLFKLAEELVAAFPSAALADDNSFRKTDVTIDIGEYQRVPPNEVEAMRSIAKSRGVRTLASSVHLHLTHTPADKASGTLRLIYEHFGEDPTLARQRYAYVGDSGNDATAFAAFKLGFGVANIRRHLDRFSVPPRYVAPHAMGLGFSEIVARLHTLRTGPP